MTLTAFIGLVGTGVAFALVHLVGRHVAHPYMGVIKLLNFSYRSFVPGAPGPLPFYRGGIPLPALTTGPILWKSGFAWFMWLAIVVAVVAYHVTNAVCAWHFGQLPYPNKIFTSATFMLGLNFPLWVAYCDFWQMWPLPAPEAAKAE